MNNLEQTEKSPVPIEHPLLEANPLAKPSPGLFEWSETCVDLLEAILKHHNGRTLELGIPNNNLYPKNR